jgi:hypothetical protein
MSTATSPSLSGVILRFAGYVLAGLSFASLALAFFLAQKALLFADDVVRTTGTVVGYRESPQPDGRKAHTPRIVFHPTPEERVTVFGQLTSMSPRDPIGSIVPIRYVRQDPGSARIDRFVDNMLGPAVAAGLGMLCALLAGVLTRSGRTSIRKGT